MPYCGRGKNRDLIYENFQIAQHYLLGDNRVDFILAPQQLSDNDSHE